MVIARLYAVDRALRLAGCSAFDESRDRAVEEVWAPSLVLVHVSAPPHHPPPTPTTHHISTFYGGRCQSDVKQFHAAFESEGEASAVRLLVTVRQSYFATAYEP